MSHLKKILAKKDVFAWFACYVNAVEIGILSYVAMCTEMIFLLSTNAYLFIKPFFKVSFIADVKLLNC